jgi:PAS domain-containing protein
MNGHTCCGAFRSWESSRLKLFPRIHPEDLDRVRAAFAATRNIRGNYETDFRVLHDGKIRWISARGRGDDQGIVGRIMYGVFIDVTERKRLRKPAKCSLAKWTTE